MRRCYLLACLICLLVCGCGESGPQRAAITGEVTFNGEPIETGSIQFVPELGVVGKSVATQITQGKFELSLDKGPAVGKNKVLIQASRKTGKKVKDIMGEMVEQTVPFVPAKYNKKSELIIEIKPGDNTETFLLEGPAP